MLIFFVGIVPMISLLILGAYYFRNNVKFSSWKKAPASYVSTPLTSKWKHVLCACCSCFNTVNSIPSVSQSVQNSSKKPDSGSFRSKEITAPGLISTTNRQIQSSTDILATPDQKPESKRRMSFKNLRRFTLSRGKDNDLAKSEVKPPPARRMSIKNIRNLTVNVDIKHERLRVPSNNDDCCPTPDTAETTVSTTPVKLSVKELTQQLNKQQMKKYAQ